jgi:hypothetical protein
VSEFPALPPPPPPNAHWQTANARRVFHFHIRGHTLTFSAGAVGAALVPQAGTWLLPEQFYLLVSTYRLGYEFKATFVTPGAPYGD